MSINIEWWRQRDLNPPKGYKPTLELAGRKRRLEAARKLANENGIEIDSDPDNARIQLFNLYYDSLEVVELDED